MDNQLREAERAGRGAPWLRAKMRIGELSESKMKLLAHLGYPGAKDIVAPEPFPCRSKGLCLGHFASGIEKSDYSQYARVTAQSIWVQELSKRHEGMGWNSPGENTLWLLLHNEREVLKTMKKEGNDRLRLADLFCDISDKLATDSSYSDDVAVKEGVTKVLIKAVLGE